MMWPTICNVHAASSWYTFNFMVGLFVSRTSRLKRGKLPPSRALIQIKKPDILPP